MDKPKSNLQNLSEVELQALNSLLLNNDIIIQKVDKGIIIVAFDKDTY